MQDRRFTLACWLPRSDDDDVVLPPPTQQAAVSDDRSDDVRPQPFHPSNLSSMPASLLTCAIQCYAQHNGAMMDM